MKHPASQDVTSSVWVFALIQVYLTPETCFNNRPIAQTYWFLEVCLIKEFNLARQEIWEGFVDIFMKTDNYTDTLVVFGFVHQVCSCGLVNLSDVSLDSYQETTDVLV